MQLIAAGYRVIRIRAIPTWGISSVLVVVFDPKRGLWHQLLLLLLLSRLLPAKSWEIWLKFKRLKSAANYQFEVLCDFSCHSFYCRHYQPSSFVVLSSVHIGLRIWILNFPLFSLFFCIYGLNEEPLKGHSSRACSGRNVRSFSLAFDYGLTEAIGNFHSSKFFFAS